MKSKAHKKESFPIGYLSFCKDFKEAAETLRKNAPHGRPYVRYYLLCHALELLLKAYLKEMGFREDNLKKNYGHDLDKLLQVAKNSGLDKYVTLTASEVRVISEINIYYKEKELEYLITGFKVFPDIEKLQLVLGHLFKELKQFLFQEHISKMKKKREAEKLLKPPKP